MADTIESLEVDASSTVNCVQAKDDADQPTVEIIPDDTSKDAGSGIGTATA
jgi:hypothetical protein